jgi:hypothetical protein
MRKTLKVVAFGGGPAEAFIKAAGITDSTQQTAIKTLVNDLNGYGLWSKMKAIYPMVGGTATSHSYNLKDTTKFQITFNGGWTHSSTGALPNGTNAYADTGLNASTQLTTPSHLSYYTRTNANTGIDQIDIGIANFWLSLWYTGSGFNNLLARNQSSTVLLNGGTITNSQGFGITTKISNTSKIFFNNTQKDSQTDTTNIYTNNNIYIGAFNNGYPALWSNRQNSFTTIGEGLTDTEASNLYTAIQKFQTTLNRFVGTPIYPSFDSDAQSFMTSASITDSTQQAAVNYLVTDLKANSLWDKMKAVYPMVGGSATSHSYNLKNPSQYQITFNGGWTHSSTGALPNGTNAYGNTFLSPNTSLNLNNAAISYYSRTNGFSSTPMGAGGLSNDFIIIVPRFSSGALQDYSAINSKGDPKTAASNTLGFFVISRILNSSFKGFQNGSQYFNANENSSSLTSENIFIGARNMSGTASQFSNLQCAFSTIGDGLTDTEASNLYTIIQNYQTILSRQV